MHNCGWMFSFLIGCIIMPSSFSNSDALLSIGIMGLLKLLEIPRLKIINANIVQLIFPYSTGLKKEARVNLCHKTRVGTIEITWLDITNNHVAINKAHFLSNHWFLSLFSWNVLLILLLEFPLEKIKKCSEVYTKCQEWFWMFEAYLEWNFK